MRLTTCILAALTFVAANAAFAAEKRRELDAHQHGRGTLSIAIEGTSVNIELEVPAHDIVGFEHEASTPEQQNAVEEATALLEEGKDLFNPPEDAGCALDKAEVESETGEEAGHGDHGKDGHQEGEKGAHSGFHATYVMTCTAPDRLTSLTASYFKAFDKAESLDVTVVGPNGQTRTELTRAAPRLDLGSDQ